MTPYIYATTDTGVFEINTQTGVSSGPLSTSVGNQLGVTRGGGTAIWTSGGRIIKYDAATGTTTSIAQRTVAGIGAVAGGVNPVNGLFYYGGFGPTLGKFSVFVYDPATNTTTGPVATITLPAGATNGNGDLAFDSLGRAYVLVSGPPSTLVRIDQPLPTRLPTQQLTSTTVVSISGVDTGPFGGYAFGADGYLYASHGSSLFRIDPNTGVVTAAPAITGPAASTGISDLGTCAVPNTIQVQKNLPAGRSVPTDQFGLAVTGNGISVGNTGTTTGSQTGIQNQDPSEIAGPVLGVAGRSYSIAETATSGTNLSDYATTWSCENLSASSTTVASGTGTSGSFVLPSGGADIVCTFTNTPLVPKIAVTKASTTTSITAVGQQVPYTFQVSNAGNVPLTNVSVTDAQSAPAVQGNLSPVTCPSPSLAPGATETCSATYTVTQADLDHGQVTDTATATGTPPSGSPVTSPPSALTIPGAAAPAVSLVKGVSKVTDVNGNGITDAGDQIFYTFNVTNAGNVSVASVAVSDPLLAANSIPITCPSSTLAPGASEVCTAAAGYVISQADADAGGVSNTATAQGTPPGSPTPVISPPSSTSTPTAAQPGISLTKTPSSTTLVAGQPITYTLVATNTGGVTLSNTSIAEGSFTGSGSLSALSCNPAQPATLAPGAKLTCTATYTPTQTDANAGSITNTANVSGTPPGSTTPVTASASATVTSAQAVSCSSLYGLDWTANPHTIWQVNPTTGANVPVTTVNNTGLLNGLAVDQSTNTFWFTSQANNQSTVTIYRVNALAGTQTTFTVTAPTASGILAGAFDPANGLYYFGGTNAGLFALYAFNTVTQTFVGQVANMGWGSNATVNNLSDIAFDSAGHMYFTTDSTGSNAPSRLWVTELPVPSTAGSGNLLANLISTSPANQATSGGLAFGSDGYLYLSQTVPGTIQQINPTTGALVATRTLTPTAHFGDIASCASPNVIQAQKNLPNGRVGSGDQFTVTITGNGVQSTGNQGTTAGTTTGVQNQSPSEVAGPIVGLAGLVYTVAETAAGSTNLAAYVSNWNCVNTATGSSVASGPGTTGSFTMPNTGAAGATIMCTFTNVPAAPAISLVKTASTQTPTLGQTVTYTLVATNTGNVPLTNASIAEGAFSGSGSLSPLSCNPAQPTTLAVGAKLTCTATYVVTQADVDAGKVTNSATATGTPPAGPAVTATDTATINPSQAPALGLVKGVSKITDVNGNGISDAGDQIFYKFTVTNTGNVTMSNIAVNDPLLAANSITVTCPSSSLAPGGSEVCTANSGYVIAQADVDAGGVSNTATANGTPPGSTTPVPSPPSSTSTPTADQPQISLVKTADTNTLVAGQTITYTLVATNTGDVTLTNASISESSFTGSGSLSALSCNPAQPVTLAPGAKLTCTATYVVSQADVNAGSLTNTATAQGTPPGSSTPVVSPPATVTITQPAGPALGLVKGVSKVTDANGNGITDAGDQIFYKFEVTNTGNVTMSSIAVSDPLLAANSITVTCPSPSLAPGTTEVCTADAGYVITQADVDAGGVSNTATSQGTPPGSTTPVPSPPSSTSTPTTSQASIRLTKTPSTNALVLGQTITYTLVATNTGDVTLTDASINEGSFTGSGSLSALSCNPAQPATLAPGARLTCTATYVVTQADIDAGSITNTATATGTPPSGPPVTSTATATVPGSPTQPGISLTKTPSTNTLVAGQTVSYTLVATNTGDVTLSNVSISEGSFSGSGSLSALSCNPAQPATWAPGAKLTCTATYVVTQADVDAGTVTNTAAASGTPPSGPAVTATAQATIPGTSSPAVSLVKGVSKITDVNGNGITDAGDQIFYNFKVTNTGNVTVSSIAVNDPLLAANSITVTCPASSLAPGASEVCTATTGYVIAQADVDAGGVSNTATAHGTPPGSTTPVVSPPSSTSTPTTAQPGISLLKTADTTTLVVGQKVTYTLVATNTGDVTLSNVSINEGAFTGSGSLSPLSCTPAQPATLAPGAKLTCTATYVVTQADVDAGTLTNTATAHGTPPGSSTPVVSPPASVTITQSPSPSLSVLKSVSKITDVNGNGITDAGDQIFYSFKVTNTGTVTLSNIAVNDPLLAGNGIGVTCPSSTLAPASSETCDAAAGYVITQADVDAGGVSNTATSQGTPPGSTTPVVSPPSSASTPTTAQPGIALTKTPSSATFVAGQTITYTLVATNTGDVTLSNVSISEGSFSGSGSLSAPSCSPVQPATLAPGTKVTCTATYVATQADVDAGSVTNDASVSGTPPTGTPVTDTAHATITSSASPAMSVVKGVSKVTDANGNAITDAGDQIFYTFAVTNTGNVTVSNVAVNDPLLTSSGITVTCPSTTLAPGASETCVAATGYVITQADVDAGGVSNTATSQGTPPGSTTPVVSPPSSTSTPTTTQPGISLTKTPSTTTFVVGQKVTYTLVATNTGDVTLSSVSISEGAFTGSGSLSVLSCNPTQPATLAPGGKLTCTASYVATQADVDAGAVTNHASVSGNPPTGAPVTDTAQATITSAPAPALSLVKSVSKITDVNGNGITDAGDQIFYTFAVTNTGNVTVSDVTVSDPLLIANGIGVTCPSPTLAPAASETCDAAAGYVITQADVDAGGVSNTATANGTPPGSTTPVVSPPSSTSTPTTVQPAIGLMKTADTTTLVAGHTITYTLVATNTGDVTLSKVSISEGAFTGSGALSSLSCSPTAPATLAPGAKLTCTATYVVTQADVDAGTLTNTATAHGTPPGSTTPVDSPPSTVTITQPASPSLSLVKSVSKITDVNGNGINDVGDQIFYVFNVTNTGNVTVTGITVNDPLLAGKSIAISCPSSSLAPAASEVCTAAAGYVITQADLDAGGVGNTATAQGTPPGGSSTPPVVSPPSSTSTPTANQPAISLTKAASTNTLVEGHTITYTMVATNTGDVTLSDVSIAEGAFSGSGTMSGLSCTPTQPATLAPGAKLTCTATYVVTQADVDAGAIVNHATATGTPPSGAPVSATAQATVPSVPSPSLSLLKRVARVVDVNHDRLTDAGDQIFYAFRVTNTGTVTISTVAVTDPLLTARKITISCPTGSLAPGASETCVATAGYVITQADVDAGAVKNTATAHGTPPGSSTPVVSPPSSTHTPTSYRPGLTLLKRFGHGVDLNHNGYVDTGDQLWWTFLVTNTGDVTVHGLQIHDPVLAAQHVTVVCNPSTLKPAQSVLCVQVQPYFVTAADQARGYVKNVAIGSAYGPGGSVVGTNVSTVVTPVGGPPTTSLPNTGGPTMTAWLAAFVSLSGGLVLMWVGRRRRTE